jgi:hypothetical protein
VRAEVESATSVLIGKPLWICRRAADMATFQFGRRFETRDFFGRPSKVGEYALHVQCAWRIAEDDHVLVGNCDLYYPADYEHTRGDVLDDFDWDHSPNRRDKLLAALFEGGKREFVVQEVKAGTAGSLHFELSKGLSLDILPNTSLDGEYWRLFRPDKDEPHFVVTGKGLEA